MKHLARIVAAAITLAVTTAGLSASPAHAKITPTPGTAAVTNDVPFIYDRGDHLTGGTERPTRSKYGYGRPVYLVGDSMAAQLADPLLDVTRAQHRALKPRTRSGTQLILPGVNNAPGRWSRRVLQQIVAERARRPIVIIAGQYASAGPLRSTVWQLRTKANAKVLIVTATPRTNREYNQCVGNAVRAHRDPNRRCRWKIANTGPGRGPSLAAAKASRVPVLDLLRHVARGTNGTHPPVVRNRMVHRYGAHVTASFARTVLAAPLRSAISRAD